jgi:HSP20 family protein
MTLIQTRPQARTPRTAFDTFDALFDELWGHTPAATRQDYDLFETDDALVLELAVPGLDQDAIDVTVEGRTLTLQLGTVQMAGSESAEDERTVETADAAASEAASETHARRYWVRGLDRPSGATRRFTLPEGVHADGTTARVRNGLLRVTVPKAQEARVRKVDVQVG